MPKHREHSPLDPNCPVVKAFKEQMLGYWSDSYKDFERKHRLQCDRCQEYDADNIELHGADNIELQGSLDKRRCQEAVLNTLHSWKREKPWLIFS